MPTVIAIEAKPVEFRGVDSGFFHLYLVKRVTDEQGNVVSEKVIRGTAGGEGELETLAGVDLASSPDRRGSDTLEERHHTPLNLAGRDADDVWSIMVQHARNIDRADLDYSVDISKDLPGDDLNSNSVVASVLHTIRVDWAKTLPSGISRSEVPLVGQIQYMEVNDVLRGTESSDAILGGVGNDSISGFGQDDLLSGESDNDRLSGGTGDDSVVGGTGNDRIFGGGGDDVLRGSSGADAFIFHARPGGSAGIDIIRDFSVVDDAVWLSDTVFTNVGPEGRLKSWVFWTGSEAHDATDRIIYDSGQGVLYYDPDGTGATEQIAFAKLTTGLKMSFADFQVI
ncbi:calcium-binding protein [Microvirga sp. 0TCS3.31]